MDGDAVGITKSQRARLTCTQCHRRKIKCDKNIPCETCIKRGLGSFCSREDNAESRLATARSTSEEFTVSNDLANTLLQRVIDLEAKLQQQTNPGTEHLDDQDYTEAPSADQEETVTPVDTTDCDAATVLEFLAWGRTKDVDFARAPEHDSGPRQHAMSREDSPENTSFWAETSNRAQLDVLEALMPSRSHLCQLVDYHNHSLLWYHNSYSSQIFSDDFESFVTKYNGDVHYDQLNLQWLALLFAIMTGSMTCASPATVREWGFSDAEQPILSKRWYEATVTCLNLAHYIETHTIYSVQAIATLTISAHVLGKSNSQTVLLASAGRIAQSLGLHRLGSDPSNMSTDQLRKREAGKRVFAQLCTQDWFQIPFSESYSLSSRFSRTVRPLNCNDEDMVLQPSSNPTQSSYCNFRYDIAALMPELLDATASCNTQYTRYEQVLQYDDKMRKLATASIPTFLAADAPLNVEWPSFASWGRRSLTICAAHKIIMIHRKFLGLSFNNSAFAFTRRTCLAAAKTILKEALAESDPRGPVIWIEQAFSVAAGIILSLDSAHRDPGEKEREEHKQLAARAIEYLRKFRHSKIASRGVQLLSFLQRELDDTSSSRPEKRPRSLVDGRSGTSRKKARLLDTQAFIRNASQSLGVVSPAATSASEMSMNVDDNPWDSFFDLLGPNTGFDGDLFENFCPA
ncbi:hypothetical protein EJ04DRAFT_496896 [Polyplosphaeria fusca]|uniref:Zn(2)-C6 fungal-type domain-containing protein n=1 Tax=Polyplosphaeria fusca TaxID=682080 RepID=A0A9P4QVN9_9PLEO|nr:hypothetical protein EJ04DRAFT_496896 [Polyplosphaeria fusca]